MVLLSHRMKLNWWWLFTFSRNAVAQLQACPPEGMAETSVQITVTLIIDWLACEQPLYQRDCCKQTPKVAWNCKYVRSPTVFELILQDCCTVIVVIRRFSKPFWVYIFVNCSVVNKCFQFAQLKRKEITKPQPQILCCISHLLQCLM